MTGETELLKANDVVSILDACHKTGVTKLTFRELNVEFGAEVTFSEPTKWEDIPGLEEKGPLPQREVPSEEEIDDTLLAIEDPALWEARQLEPRT